MSAGDGILVFCSGLDPACLSGLEAEVRVAGFYGIIPVALSAGYTIQGPDWFERWIPLPVEDIQEALQQFTERILERIFRFSPGSGRPVLILKTGMIWHLAIWKVLVDWWRTLPSSWLRFWILDPVFTTTAGKTWSSLSENTFSWKDFFVREVFPEVTILLPNELEWQSLKSITGQETDTDLVGFLYDCGVRAILRKGGHRHEDDMEEEVQDLLYIQGSGEPVVWCRSRVRFPASVRIRGAGTCLAGILSCELFLLSRQRSVHSHGDISSLIRDSVEIAMRRMNCIWKCLQSSWRSYLRFSFSSSVSQGVLALTDPLLLGKCLYGELSPDHGCSE